MKSKFKSQKELIEEALYIIWFLYMIDYCCGGLYKQKSSL